MYPIEHNNIINELQNKYKEIDPEFISPINSKSTELYKINFDHLTIDINSGYPKYFYNDNGIYAIQLRPIKNNETKLLIGCGNNPTSIYYHYPYNQNRNYLIKCNNYNNKRCNKRCNLNHIHENYVTIDPDISMNPTIITMFGKKKLPFLPDHYFSKIETEGINLAYFKNYEKEKKRLLIESY